MKKKATMALLIELRRRERDRVAAIAAQAQRDADAAAGTMRMLTDYRNDYEARSPKNIRSQTSTLKVRVHEAFVARLGGAINEQDVLLNHLNARQQQQRAVLVDRERGLRALETLVRRREQAQLKRQESLEQKQSDEFATQAHARARRRKADHD